MYSQTIGLFHHSRNALRYIKKNLKGLYKFITNNNDNINLDLTELQHALIETADRVTEYKEYAIWVFRDLEKSVETIDNKLPLFINKFK